MTIYSRKPSNPLRGLNRGDIQAAIDAAVPGSVAYACAVAARDAYDADTVVVLRQVMADLRRAQ